MSLAFREIIFPCTQIIVPSLLPWKYREVGGGYSIGGGVVEEFRFLVPMGGRSCKDNDGGGVPVTADPHPADGGGEGSP